MIEKSNLQKRRKRGVCHRLKATPGKQVDEVRSGAAYLKSAVGFAGIRPLYLLKVPDFCPEFGWYRVKLFLPSQCGRKVFYLYITLKGEIEYERNAGKNQSIS